jgi:hypothetical protein
VLPVKVESAKTGPFDLGNRILQFSLKLQIVLQLDQAQTMRTSQGVAHLLSSLKYSHVRASTGKYDNKKATRSTMVERRLNCEDRGGRELTGEACPRRW